MIATCWWRFAKRYGHVFDGGEVGGHAVGSHAALVVAEHHIPPGAGLSRWTSGCARWGRLDGNHDNWREIKPSLMLGFSVRLTAAFTMTTASAPASCAVPEATRGHLITAVVRVS